MTTKTTDKPADTTTTELAQPAITDPEYGQPDADGNRWATVKEADGIRVHVVTSKGQGMNVLADTETKAKTTLAAYLKKAGN